MNRRDILRSALRAASGLFLAPAIVHAENIMRVKPVVTPDDEDFYLMFVHPDAESDIREMLYTEERAQEAGFVPVSYYSKLEIRPGMIGSIDMPVRFINGDHNDR